MKVASRVIAGLLMLFAIIIILPITSSAEDTINQNKSDITSEVLKSDGSNSDVFTFIVSNTVVGLNDTGDIPEFTFTGKIQIGTTRKAVKGDYWYGTSEIVYEGLQVCTSKIEYIKIDTDSGSVIDTGVVTPNSYGLFFFKLRHNETIEFSVDKMDNMGFYLFETPDERYDTKAIFNENEYKGTINVLTGETIGVGAIPSGMETRYYEANMVNMSKEYAPKLHPLICDVNVNYINESKIRTGSHCVSYHFLSETQGKEIPQEVMDLLPDSQVDIPDGADITPIAPAQKEVSVTDGKWVFDGYTSDAIRISGSDGVFVGSWKFHPDEMKAMSDNECQESSQQTEAYDTPTENTQKKQVSGKSFEKRVFSNCREIGENKKIAVSAQTATEDCFKWEWLTTLLIMCASQCALSVSILSDLHVLRWYTQKKGANSVRL